MRFAVISLTAKGGKIAPEIVSTLNENHQAVHYCFHKYPAENGVIFEDLQSLVNELFYVCDGLIFVSAAGIAVRKIAPLLRSKLTDPAVVAVDEGGRFAVSLLSGHMGGANALTEFIAAKIGATPVITTATDTGGKFSPDSFAVANNLHICDMKAAKELAAEVLNGEKIGISSDFPYKNLPSDFTDDCNAEYGICISENKNKKPFLHTLNFVPKNISVGFGCKKNTDCEMFENFVLDNLKQNNIDITQLRFAATIDIKMNETAILQFCRKYSIPLKFFTAQQLMTAEGEFTSSEFVKKTTGADNVCERSAAMEGGKIIVPKYSENGMTFAAAVNQTDIDFERRIF